MENQNTNAKSEKILDITLPTYIAPYVPTNDQTQYHLADFSILKVNSDPPTEEAPAKDLDISDPDDFVIGKPNSQNYVDLDFDLDGQSAVNMPVTNGINATEKQNFTSENDSMVNATRFMDSSVSCMGKLLSDLPEESEEENENSIKNKNDSDWYSKDFKEAIVTTANVAFALQAVAVVLPCSDSPVADKIPEEVQSTLSVDISGTNLKDKSFDVSIVSESVIINEPAKQPALTPSFEAENVATKIVDNQQPAEADEPNESSSVASESGSINSVPESASVPPSLSDDVSPTASVTDSEVQPPPVHKSAQDGQLEHRAASTELNHTGDTTNPELHTSASSAPQVPSPSASPTLPQSEVKKETVSAAKESIAASEEEVPLSSAKLAAVDSGMQQTSAESVAVPASSRVQAVSLTSSVAPDSKPLSTTTSTTGTTIMGRKNQSYRRENSSDEAEYSGPDQVKEYIENVLGPKVSELIYWRDPKNSGIVLGVGLVILLSLSIFSVISVVAYTLLLTLLSALSFRIYKNVMQTVNKTSEGHPFKEYLEVEIVPPQERIHEIVESVVSHGTCFVKRMRSVLLVEDIVDSLKYLLTFWAFTHIGAWFNGITLVILAYISAFALPTVYEQNKPQIDTYLDLVNTKITEISDKVPFLKKTPVPAEKKEE